MNTEAQLKLLFLSIKVSVTLSTLTSCYHDNAAWTIDNLCLEIVNQELSWYNARNYCASRGGDLVEIRSQRMQDSIVKHLKTGNGGQNGFWIGATDTDYEGVWQWLQSPKAMSYSNWSPSHGPNNHGFMFAGYLQDCAMIRTDANFTWYDDACDGIINSLHYQFICQYDLVQSTTDKSPAISTTTVKSTPSNKASTTHQAATTKLSFLGECPYCNGELQTDRCKANTINCRYNSKACFLTFTNTGAFAGCSDDLQQCYRATHSNQHTCGYRPIPFNLYPEFNCSYCCDITSHNCFNNLLNQIVYDQSTASRFL